ncbi:complement C1q and tumor necrosis factor-related protein 9B-like [Mytilus trossulus]|uniref:complement C1q and tumor necrosis factor-related protein 9B-like n=1 Tax=Mytilus trossulus TaxID=6551 RepID=UPI003005985C
MLSGQPFKYVLYVSVFSCLCGSFFASDRRFIMNGLNSTNVDLRFQQMDQTIQTLKTQVSTYDNVVLSMQSKVSHLESTVKRLSASDCPAIAFMTTLKNTLLHVQSGVQLKFDNVILNSGNAYNSFHGNFIAPRTGTYFFTYSITSTAHSWIRIKLLRNGIDVGHLINTDHDSYLKTTESVLVHLNQNDDVWLQTDDAQGPDSIGIMSGFHSLESHFAGFLLFCN